MKAKFVALKMSYQTENFLICNFPSSKDHNEGSLIDEEISVDSDGNEDSLNSKEELKESLLESSLVQENKEIKSKERKSKNFSSMNIKEKDQIDDFMPEFIAKINLRRKNLMIEEKCLHENKDLNMFDFNFDKQENYKIYYHQGNLGNNLKKLQIYMKSKEKKRRRTRNTRKEKKTSAFVNIN